MSIFRHIVVATDFGASSQKALDLAVELAERDRAELTLVHAVERFVPPYPIALDPAPGVLDRAARTELNAEAARLRQRFPGAKDALLDGEPATAVSAYAAEHGADLLVIGTHGRRGPSRWLLGSVAEKVVRSSRAPVLVVRAEERG